MVLPGGRGRAHNDCDDGERRRWGQHDHDDEFERWWGRWRWGRDDHHNGCDDRERRRGRRGRGRGRRRKRWVRSGNRWMRPRRYVLRRAVQRGQHELLPVHGRWSRLCRGLCLRVPGGVRRRLRSQSLRGQPYFGPVRHLPSGHAGWVRQPGQRLRQHQLGGGSAGSDDLVCAERAGRLCEVVFPGERHKPRAVELQAHQARLVHNRVELRHQGAAHLKSDRSSG